MPPSVLLAQADVQDNQGVLSPGARLWYDKSGYWEKGNQETRFFFT